MKSCISSFEIDIVAKKGCCFEAKRTSPFYDHEDPYDNIVGLAHETYGACMDAGKKATRALEVEEGLYWDCFTFTFRYKDETSWSRTILEGRKLAKAFIKEHFKEEDFMTRGERREKAGKEWEAMQTV